MSTINGKNVKFLQELKGHTNDVTCMEFWGNVLLVTGSSDKSVRLWKWTVGSGFVEEAISPLLGHTYGITSLKISPRGGVLATSSRDGTIILWDLSNGQQMNILYQENGEAVRCCAFSPNGNFIAAADDNGSICIWGQEKNLIKKYHYHEETIYTVNFSPDSQILLTGCNTGQICMVVIDKEVDTNESSTHPIYDCAIDNAHDLGVTSSDFFKSVLSDPLNTNTIIYTVVTSGTDQVIKIWRIYVLKNSKVTDEPNRLIPGLGDHESGSSIIYSTKLMNAECVQAFMSHGSSITCVKLNKRGTMIVSASLDKTIKMWSTQGKPLGTLTKHKRYVNCVAISEASNILASGSNDRNIIVWDLTSSLTLESRIAGLSSMVFDFASKGKDIIPMELLCPLSHEIMNNPVRLDDGFSYEKSAITEWLNSGQIKSPMTNEELKSLDIVDNCVLKGKIETFLKSMDFGSFTATAANLNESD